MYNVRILVGRDSPVQVADLMGSDVPMIRGTSKKSSQAFGLYYGSGCNFPIMY